MNLESILDCQERGSRARILGSHRTENPYKSNRNAGELEDETSLLYEAWEFGWSIEDCIRQIGTGFYLSLRNQSALAAGKLVDT
ncbi:CrpP-related protein [Rhizobium lemnae]|uniref:CrpP-related protein n=1 Tax=Rhizobium lemnae TaxID=1214924 RepID=A0ABV8E604_9HYPH